jgi:hypothetical protein
VMRPRSKPCKYFGLVERDLKKSNLEKGKKKKRKKNLNVSAAPLPVTVVQLLQRLNPLKGDPPIGNVMSQMDEWITTSGGAPFEEEHHMIDPNDYIGDLLQRTHVQRRSESHKSLVFKKQFFGAEDNEVEESRFQELFPPQRPLPFPLLNAPSPPLPQRPLPSFPSTPAPLSSPPCERICRKRASISRRLYSYILFY